MEVTATGAGIKVPVGEKTLGRLFNVLGETIDDGDQITDSEEWVIHRDPPTFEDQSPVVTFWRPTQRAVRSVSSAEPAWARPC